MRVDHGTARASAGARPMSMSSVYAESKCLPFDDAILTFLCLNREYHAISFPDCDDVGKISGGLEGDTCSP